MFMLLIAAVVAIWLIGQFFSAIGAAIAAIFLALMLLAKFFDTAAGKKVGKKLGNVSDAINKKPQLIIIPCGIIAAISFFFLFTME